MARTDGLFTSKYKESYPELFIKICKKKGSICDFCVEIGIGRATFYEWVDKYPDFKKAFHIGKELTEQWLTQEGINGMKADKFNATVWSILMRNKCSYVEHRKVGIDFSSCKTPDEKMALLDQRVSEGRLTPKEAKDYADYIKASAEIHEKTEITKQVDELMQLAAKK